MDNGAIRLTLWRGRTGRDRWLSIFFALPRKKTFELDEVGVWFWEQCDGTRSIGDLGRALARRWEIGPETARQAVFRYAGVLARRGLMILEVPREGESAAPAAASLSAKTRKR